MIVQTVFLSHATEDHDIALRVRDYLEQEHIRVWLAPEDIAVGAPNWEEAIRKAIESAEGLLLIATPDTRQSPFVRGEVEIARSKIPIFILWARGEAAEDTMLLEHIKAQFTDVRGTKFNDGMQLLLASLRGEVGSESRIHKQEVKTRKSVQDHERKEIFRTFRSRVITTPRQLLSYPAGGHPLKSYQLRLPAPPRHLSWRLRVTSGDFG